MSRPIYEPDPEAKIAGNAFGVKDLRFRPFASRWYEPDCSGGVDCDGDEPTLTGGNFTQPTSQPFGQDIEKFAYRFSKDGSLQTKGILDASGAASGDFAFTLPGVADPDNDVYSIPNSNPNAPTDQAFALRVTTTGDDSGTTPATGYVDSATGDVYVRWTEATGASFPWIRLKLNSRSVANLTWKMVPFRYLEYDPALVTSGVDYSWTEISDGEAHKLWQVTTKKEGIYLYDCQIRVEQPGTTATDDGYVQLRMTDGVNELDHLYAAADWFRQTTFPSGSGGEIEAHGVVRISGVIWLQANRVWKPQMQHNVGGTRAIEGSYFYLVRLEEVDFNNVTLETTT